MVKSDRPSPLSFPLSREQSGKYKFGNELRFIRWRHEISSQKWQAMESNGMPEDRLVSSQDN